MGADVDERDARFIGQVWREGRLAARDELPWRFLDDPYAVWVSEVMLQQTQVARVLTYWPRFMRALPTLDALAAASVQDVLALWQGLGYNRRALALKRTADECALRFGGKLPRGYGDLVALPGIGPATAAGIRAFAWQEPGVYLETNVRTVYLRAYFPDAQRVRDADLTPIVERTCSRENPREWYYALLDWGAALKAQGALDGRRSAAYARQSKFEGSKRQKRAFLVREAVSDPDAAPDDLHAALNRAEAAAGRPEVPRADFEAILAELRAEGFFG